MKHADFTDPLDIHVTRAAEGARAGTVLRYLGDGSEEAFQAHLGHLDLILTEAGDYTLTDEQIGYASLRVSGPAGTPWNIIVPAEYGPVLIENAFADEQTIIIQCLAGATIAIGRGQKQLVVARNSDVTGFLVAAQQGYQEIDLTDLDEYDLTAYDLSCAYLKFIGAPTASISLFVPNDWGGVIENAMSGTQTMTAYKVEGGNACPIRRGRPHLVEAGPAGLESLLPKIVLTHLDVDVSGLTAHTLTESQQGTGSLRFTGALTGNCVVTIPDEHGPVTVENATTGAYTLSFVRLSGGNGREVVQGTSDILVARGGVVAGVLPAAPVGHLDVDLAGLATLTLTSPQARAASLRFTGALTQNCIVTVPNDWGPVVLENATTGAYSLTLSRASGGTSLVVTQTKRVLALARTGAVLAMAPEV